MRARDEMIISCFDLKKLFFKVRSQLQCVAIICGFLVVLVLLFQPPMFVAKATFKQGESNRWRGGSQLEDLFNAFGGSSTQERGIVGMMRSQILLRDVIGKLGMQVHWSGESYFKKWIGRVWKNIGIEIGCQIDPVESLIFRNVCFDAVIEKVIWIKILNDSSFELFNHQRHSLGVWHLNELIELPFFQASLVHIPVQMVKNKCYQLVLLPWQDVIEDVRSCFVIKPVKYDSMLFQLFFRDANGQLAADFLNQVMASYQEYIRKDNEQIALDQLNYLEKRQEELCIKWDGSLQEHVAYVKSNLDNGGGFDFEQDLKHLQVPQQEYSSRLLTIDFELNRLRSKTSKTRLKQHSDIGMASDLLSLSQQKEIATMALDQLQSGQTISCDLSLLNQPKQLASIWGKQIFLSQMDRDGKIVNQKNQLESYLTTFIQHSDAKIKALAENRELHAIKEHELKSLTLPAAQELFINYNSQRDGLQAQLTQLVHLAEQLYQPYFELSSVTLILSDSVTEQLVIQAGEVAARLQDENNQSMREQGRLKEVLVNKKKFISQHLAQIIELTKLKITLIEDKIDSLRTTTLTLLDLEKQLIQQQLYQISQKMEALPDRWRKENVLMLQKEIGIKMIEGLAQLTESKNIDRHLYHVGSKPLDAALLPRCPQKLHLTLYGILAALLGSIGCYCYYFFKSSMRGFPLTHQGIIQLGWESCGSFSQNRAGSLSELAQNDLEVLRKEAQFILKHKNLEGGMCCVILGGKHPNMTPLLGEILFMHQLRVLVMDYVFDQPVSREQMPGLIQYLQGEEAACPIRKELYYDYLPSGGTCRYGVEWLSHKELLSYLVEAKAQYDVILFYTTAVPTDMIGNSLCSIADTMIIGVQDETRVDLYPYQEWGSAPLGNRVMFTFF